MLKSGSDVTVPGMRELRNGPDLLFIDLKNNFSHVLGCLKRESGLTLLELMIAVAIVGVLAAIAIPYYRGYIAISQYNVVMSNLQIISREVTAFNITNQRYPDDLTEIGLGNLKDPWDSPYQYLNIANVTGKGKLRKDHSLVPVNTDFDLYSMGPDGDSQPPFTAKASRDDLVRANNGGFFGRVSDY